MSFAVGITLLGTMRMCTGARGRMSRKAVTRSSRYTILAGTSPEMIRSKRLGMSAILYSIARRYTRGLEAQYRQPRNPSRAATAARLPHLRGRATAHRRSGGCGALAGAGARLFGARNIFHPAIRGLDRRPRLSK